MGVEAKNQRRREVCSLGAIGWEESSVWVVSGWFKKEQGRVRFGEEERKKKKKKKKRNALFSLLKTEHVLFVFFF